MRVAVIGETSGRVRDAFIRRGHDAVSFDLLPTDAPGHHVQGDARDADLSGFDLFICHPPCTRLCNSGVCWLSKRNLWAELDEAAKFFRWCMGLGERNVCENPIPHKYALTRIGRKYDQIIHPWQHGHGESKATCLWLRGVPPLEPSNVVDGREQRLHRLPPSPDRWKQRSETFAGVANAMADQWGKPDKEIA